MGEFGKNALKNIDNQILKINTNITDNQTALKEAKDLLNNFVRATNVFKRLKKLEEKRAEREKKWQEKMRKREKQMAQLAKKQRAKLERQLKEMSMKSQKEIA